MNYRHIYHAGNFADVFKHILLTLALDHLRQKEKPFFVLDTHAGIGLYDLAAEEAAKTNEAVDAIGKLWARTDIPKEARIYLDIVKKYNKEIPRDARDDSKEALRFYPGSPLIVKDMLRADDRFVANELHPEDNRMLYKLLGNDARIRVEKQDGYAQMRAHLPPHERRGLVLADPPFEVTDEFEQMTQGLAEGYKRWATGIYMLWYPIKDPRRIKKFHEALAETGIPKITAFDFMRRAPDNPEKLNGCGLAVVNSPWTLVEQAGKIGPWLVDALTGGQGRFEVKQITGEN